MCFVASLLIDRSFAAVAQSSSVDDATQRHDDYVAAEHTSIVIESLKCRLSPIAMHLIAMKLSNDAPVDKRNVVDGARIIARAAHRLIAVRWHRPLMALVMVATMCRCDGGGDGGDVCSRCYARSRKSSDP